MVTPKQSREHEAFFNFCHSKNAYGYLDILEMVLNAKIPHKILSDYVKTSGNLTIDRINSIAFFIYDIEIEHNNYNSLKEIKHELIKDYKESVSNGFMWKDDDYVNQVNNMF
jgi:hypothetical protein